MGKAPHAQAAFINAIADEGTKDEAVQFLQETWNELCEARDEITALRARLAEVESALKLNQDLDAINVASVNELTARAERAEAALETMQKERDQWQRKHESQLKVDFDLVDKYRRPKSGNFHFPEDVAHIIRKLDAAEAALEAANEGLTAAYLAGVADEKARQAEALATARRLANDAIKMCEDGYPVSAYNVARQVILALANEAGT